MPFSTGVRGRKIRTLEQVRALLAHTIRELEADRMSETKARALGYLAHTIADIIRNADVEARLDEIEKILAQPPAPQATTESLEEETPLPQ